MPQSSMDVKLNSLRATLDSLKKKRDDAQRRKDPQRTSNNRAGQKSDEDVLPTSTSHRAVDVFGRYTVETTAQQRMCVNLKHTLLKFANYLMAGMRECKVLDRSARGAIVGISIFMILVIALSIKGHESRGYIHADERNDYREDYEPWGSSRVHKALYHPVFHARRVVDRVKNNLERESYASSHAVEKHPYSTKVSFECPERSCVNVADVGAIGDGISVNTVVIQQAIDRLAARGGGTVAFPPGRWLSGPIELKSHVKIVLDGPRSSLEAIKTTDGWIIDEWKEYPSLPSDDPLPIFRAFIHAYNQTNIEILGGGTINGHGDFWWNKKTDDKYSPTLRKTAHVPNLIHLVGCNTVTIENIVLTNSPHFTVRPQYCSNVQIKRIHIQNPANSPGTNGVVFDSTKDSTLSDSVITTGDKEDAVAIKSGKDKQGRKANVPSMNIKVEHVTILGGHALSVGSEMSGGVKNIVFSDIIFDGRNNKFGVGSARVKTMRGRGGYVDNITFQNIRGWNALYALELYEYYSKQDTNLGPVTREETPVVKNIFFKNVHIEGIKRYAGVIAGLPELPVENLVINNVHLTNVHKGWNCHKFSECNWAGGGCTYGPLVTDVNPAIPDNCILDISLMPHMQGGTLWNPVLPVTGNKNGR